MFKVMIEFMLIEGGRVQRLNLFKKEAARVRLSMKIGILLRLWQLPMAAIDSNS
jgi:hypothetical protein